MQAGLASRQTPRCCIQQAALRLQAHLQAVAQVLGNIVACDVDHDLTPLGLPHVHQAIGVAVLSGRVQAGSTLILTALLLIHSLRLGSLGHLQAWQGDACQRRPTGLVACTGSHHTALYAQIVPTAGQSRSSGIVTPASMNRSAMACLSCHTSTAWTLLALLAHDLHRQVAMLREGCREAPQQCSDARVALVRDVIRTGALEVPGASCFSDRAGCIAVGGSSAGTWADCSLVQYFIIYLACRFRLPKEYCQRETVLTMSSSNFSHCLPPGRMKAQQWPPCTPLLCTSTLCSLYRFLTD